MTHRNDFDELVSSVRHNSDDTDEFPLWELSLQLPAGLAVAGEYGWCNDTDWYEGVINRADVECNSAQPCAVLTQALTRALDGLDWTICTVAHEDDDWNNRGTSETCAWWSHYLLVRTDLLEEVARRIDEVGESQDE